MRQLLIISIVIGVLASAPAARGEGGRLRTDLVTTLGKLPGKRHVAAGVGVGAGVGLDEFLELRGRALWYEPNVFELTTGVAGRLDILRWVPVASASVGWSHAATSNSPLVRLELGVDYLLSRRWFAVIRGSARAALAEEQRGVAVGGFFGLGHVWGF